MKKLWISLIILATMGIVVGGFLIFNQPKKDAQLSNSYINFSLDESAEFMSGLKADETWTSYDINFSTSANKNFGAVSITTSLNVELNKNIIDGKNVSANFVIKNGTSFWIKFDAKNYKSKMQNYYYVTPYVSSLEMKFEGLVNAENNKYNLQKSGNGYYNVLYFLSAENYSAGILDEYPCKVSYSLNISQFSKDDFTITLSKTGVLVVDEINHTITAVAIDTCVLTFTANDGSGFVKNVYFRVKKPLPKSVVGLENTAQIDLAETSTFAFPTYSVLPAYTNKNDLVFTPSTANFSATKTSIIATNVGTGTLEISNGEKTIFQISVSVSQTARASFLVELYQNPNNLIEFDLVSKTATLTLSNFEDETAVVAFKITIQNFNQSTRVFDIPVSYTDENGILYSVQPQLIEKQNNGPASQVLSFIIIGTGTITFTIQNTESTNPNMNIAPQTYTIIVN